LLALSPLLLLLLAEGALRALGAATAADPYLTLAGRASALTRKTVAGAEHFEFTHPHAYGKDSGVTFARVKAPGTVRVLVMGSSASAGWPHRPPQRWTDYLQTALARAFPQRQFEVINLGAHACASYRIRLIFDEAIECAPDAVVIYCGNNEFVEKRSYLLDFPGKRLVDALKQNSVLVARLAQWWTARTAPDNVLSGTEREHVNHHLWTHTERIASELRSDPRQFQGVREHYRYSVAHMVAQAQRRGARVFVLTVPVNLRDWSPAVSTPVRDPARATEFTAAFHAGCAHLLRDDPARALAALANALAVEPEHAEAHFQRGRALDRLRRHDEAYEAYSCALDADRNPFRVSRPLNAILREVVAAHPGAHLVDAVGAFRDAARDHLPGFDLMLDYVHPTRDGNLVLARVTFAALLASGLLGPATSAQFEVPDDGYRDEHDEGLQLNLLALFGIMHQYEAYLGKAEAFTALLGKHGQAPPAPVANVLANTRAEFTAYLAARRQEILGEPFDPGYRARHDAFYKQFFVFASELKGALTERDWRANSGGK
jgi:tetratricopeptide (TPR) repeat protein